MTFTPPIPFDDDAEVVISIMASVTINHGLEILWSKRKDGPIRHRTVGTFAHSAGDRTRERFNFFLGGSGYLHAMTVTADTPVKRGQSFIEMGLGKQAQFVTVGTGYAHFRRAVIDGMFEGPLDGKGHLFWEQEADDIAGSAITTVNFAVTNARRIIRAILIKYHSSSDAATRTLTATLRDVSIAVGPTGWSIDSDTWVSPTLTLTVNEEGLMHVDDHGFVSVNDAGTITYSNTSTAPNPFPMIIEEGDAVDLIVAVGSGHANDDYDVWVKYEEWIEV